MHAKSLASLYRACSTMSSFPSPLRHGLTFADTDETFKISSPFLSRAPATFYKAHSSFRLSLPPLWSLPQEQGPGLIHFVAGAMHSSRYSGPVPFLEKDMAPHSSTLAWRIPGTGEPGGLPSMGSHRVGHD